MSDMLAAAIEFAARGWPVFPIRALGKTPLTARGFKDATTDPTAIRVWWAKWPSANIAVATGPSSVVAVDIDGDEGEDSLVALTAQYGPLPETLESRTGRGRHLFFVVTGSTIRNDIGRKLGRGIDVRGTGGYVVVPPSVHESGKRYEWIRGVSPAPLPGWLLKKLSATLRVKNNNNGHTRIAAGQRNSTLASLAGTMRKRGMSRAAILAALLDTTGNAVIRRCPNGKSGLSLKVSAGTRPALRLREALTTQRSLPHHDFKATRLTSPPTLQRRLLSMTG
jgi:putative DNA primase/helicase